jgi:hypothetical protein
MSDVASHDPFLQEIMERLEAIRDVGASFSDWESAILADLAEPFPDSQIRSRQGGGGRSLAYVPGYAVINRLNRVCGKHRTTWDWRITEREWRPFVQGQQKLDGLIILGELTILRLGTRAGMGVQLLSERGGEDMVKGASTDALKKAATLFGVGIDLYGEDTEDPAEDRRAAGHPPIIGRDQTVIDNLKRDQPAAATGGRFPPARLQHALPEVTEKVMKRLFATASEKGFDPELLKRYAHKKFSVSSMNDLPIAKLTYLTNQLASGALNPQSARMVLDA